MAQMYPYKEIGNPNAVTARILVMDKDTLFYDDACPICSAEMAKLAKHHDNGLELTPISTLPVEHQAALRTELHLRTEEGEWLKGLEANVRAWQHTRYSKVANLLLHPMFRWIAELAYQTWLTYYQWARKRRDAKD
ncbi:MAG: putative DCC family thiol-disulfide oxidoreductase YuxK [Arenicella sp.]|jgi:predicted DCC family thiol-disulfide oxidoreductase YuxK